jgi:radical SAM protein
MLLATDQKMLFNERPLLVYWEMTQACDLACKHCRAEAMPQHNPLELNTEEGKRMLRQIREFGDPAPHVVMTGGDALKRKDLIELVKYSIALGLPTSVAPSATNYLTTEMLDLLKSVGVESISLSIDGSNPEKHDGFRGVPGCFDATIRMAHYAKKIGMPVQINTLVTADTVRDLPNTIELLTDLGIMRWSLFFLISVGRGKDLQPLSAGEAERLFHWLYEQTKRVPFAIKTTEAMHYRRVVYQRMRRDGMAPDQIRRTPTGRGFGIRDGNGIMFISHLGGVYPSGFLPLAAGNVRVQSPVEIYRHAELFRNLRTPEDYKGRCGVCEFRDACGGSRARAYAATGDPMETDPLCPYQPREGQAGVAEMVA